MITFPQKSSEAEFMLERLSGRGPLSAHLKNRIERLPGSFFTLMTEEQASQMRPDQDGVVYFREQCAIFLANLMETEPLSLLAEDSTGHAAVESEDKILVYRQPNPEKEIIYYTVDGKPESQVVWNAIDGPAVNWFTIGCLSRAKLPQTPAEQSIDQIHDFAEHAILAFVDAWDGNGLLMWTPLDPLRFLEANEQTKSS